MSRAWLRRGADGWLTSFRAGDKSTRDKAVASLSRFLSAGRLNHLGPLAAGAQEEEQEEEQLPVGELNWDDEYEVDARLQPLEMAKLWKGVYYCASRGVLLRTWV